MMDLNQYRKDMFLTEKTTIFNFKKLLSLIAPTPRNISLSSHYWSPDYSSPPPSGIRTLGYGHQVNTVVTVLVPEVRR